MTTQISQRCYKQSQSWYYEWTGALKGRKFKVAIRRNAYDEQSYARGFIYDPGRSEWSLIVNAPITECDCKRISYTQENVTADDFHNDADKIMDELEKICLNN